MKEKFLPLTHIGLIPIRVLVSLCVLCAFVVQIPAQDFKTVHEGVEYAEVTLQLADKEPVKINLLRLDLTKVRLDVHHALDAAIGTEKTSSIATRHGAVAAINAGFFRLDTSIFAGDAVGILKIDGTALSEATSGRAAILINNLTDRTIVEFDHVDTRSWIEIGGRELAVTGTNRERKENELVEYTPEFNRTTLTASDGIEVIVRNDRVNKIAIGAGSSRIPHDGYVLSASGSRKEEILKWMRIGQKVKRSTAVSNPRKPLDPPSYGFEDITNGVPQLIRNGKIEITWQQERSSKSFVETRHPRTAVAKMKDGKFLMVTVDGRQPGVSVGMNLNELAEYLLGLGAVDAMNLDGGGSTTMFLDGKVVNKPSGSDERKVSDAILVTLRKKPAKR